MNDTTVTRERLHRLPKAELHVHLDGSLRPQTMIELAAQRGLTLPAADAASLGDYMHVKQGRDLVDYLARFDTTLSLMQRDHELQRIAYELAADGAAENVRYMEVRFCPVLNTREGLSPSQVLEAVLDGLRRAEAEHEITTNVIVCALRSMPPEVSEEMAALAIAFRDRGVVAFDLAGAEDGFPPAKHQRAFDMAADANLPITVHAGEAFGPASIHQAVHRCHARRIGHGTRLWEDPQLMDYLNDFRIPLEICPTSNVQTRAAASIAEHPLRTYYDHGLVVTLSTDNRLMSGITLTDEYLNVHQAFGFGWTEMCEIAVMGFESAFLPYAEKRALVEAVREEIAGIVEEATT